MMQEWRAEYLDHFDNLERIVRTLAPADPDMQDRWRGDFTLTQVMQAYCELIMFQRT